MTLLQTLCAAMLLLVVQGEKRNPKQSMQVNGGGGLQQTKNLPAWTAGLMRRTTDVQRHSFESDSGMLDHCSSICPSGCDGPDDFTKRKCAKCAKCHGMNPQVERDEQALVDMDDSPEGDVPSDGDDSASTGSSGKEGDDDPSSSGSSSDDTSKGAADDTAGGDDSAAPGSSDEKSAESDEKSGGAGTDDDAPSDKDDKYDAEDQKDEEKYKKSKSSKTSSKEEDGFPDPSLPLPHATSKTDGENGNIKPGEDDLSTDYNHDMQPDVPTSHIPESLSQNGAEHSEAKESSNPASKADLPAAKDAGEPPYSERTVDAHRDPSISAASSKPHEDHSTEDTDEKDADDSFKAGSMVDSAASRKPDDDHPTEPGHGDDEDSDAKNTEVADADQGSSSSDSEDAAGAQDGEDASHKTDADTTDADTKSDSIGDGATGWMPQGAKNESPEAASDKGDNYEGA